MTFILQKKRQTIPQKCKLKIVKFYGNLKKIYINLSIYDKIKKNLYNKDSFLFGKKEKEQWKII